MKFILLLKPKDMKKPFLLAIFCILLSIKSFSQCTATINTFSPTCNGTCDGAAKAVVAGATGPFTYSWSTTPSQTTQTINGLCAGTYTVKANNASGCSVTKTVVLVQPAILTLATTQVNEKCNGNATGTATANVTGGTAPYSYSWSTTPTQTTKTARKLTAGTYTVLVTDSKGCLTSATVTITQPTALALTMSTTSTTCGGSTGTATVTVTGGTGPHTYAWNTTPVQTTAGLTGLPSGSYTVVVTDSNKCSQTSVATVGNTGGLTATLSQTNVSCRGNSDGSASLTPSGGTAPYTYSWSTFPPQTTASITGLPAGTYYANVKDASGCSFTVTVTITQPAALSATVTHVNVACKGTASGSATVTPAGGTSPYTYSWNTTPVQTTATANNLAVGTFTATITDSHGCNLIKTVAITQPANGLSATVTHTNDKCHNGTGGTATANPAGGTAPYTYSWSTAPSQTTKTATGLKAGTYHILITDSKGCSFLDSAVISQPPAIVLNTTTTSSACGGSTGSATVAISSGGVKPFTYSWNTTPAQTTSTSTALTAGVYIVTVTDSNGCKAGATATVNNTGAATATISSSINVSCRGGATGSATVTASGGTTPYTYSWNTAPVQTGATASALSAGSYTVTVTEPNGCSSIATIRITQPAAALTSTTSVVNETCNGSSTGSATVNPAGGTPAYTYSWNTVPSQTTATASALPAGTYTCHITDSKGCALPKAVTINQPGVVFGTTTKTNVTCNGGSNGVASVTGFGGTGPYTYSWSTTPPQMTRTITGLTAGSYTVMITDSKGCQKSKIVNISQPPVIAPTTTTVTAHCGNSDGSATITASGGTGSLTYSWNTTPAQTTTTASNLAPGVYTVTVTDSLGCSKTASANVNNAGAPTLTATSSNPACFGSTNGSATVTPTGGTAPYTYSWSSTPIQTTALASNLGAGVYTIKVTDTHGCSSSLQVTITQPTALTTTVSGTDVSCTATANGSATLTTSGGSHPYTYSWNTTPVQTTATASNLAPGTYTITVKDSMNCSAASTINIGKKAITATSFHSNLPCNGATTGTATVNISSGTLPFTYSWNTSPVQTTSTATGLAAGTYSVTVTDSAGCSATTSATLSQPTALAATITQINVTCNGGSNGSASVTASGGVPSYTYSWSTVPVQTTSSATNLSAGSYTLSVSDTNQCVNTQIISISQPTPLQVSITTTKATCGNATGSATVTVTGSNPGYTYSWNTTPVQTTSTATALAAGNYACQITDASGCNTTALAAVTNSTGAVGTVSSTPASCSNSTNGSATMTISGGTKPFTYSWSTTPVQTTSIATNLAPGTYSVSVTDSNGCVTPASVIVNAPPALTGASSSTAVICNGGTSGSASVIPAGGIPPYTYSWATTPVQTTQSISGLAAGTYTVTITDANGCANTVSVNVNQPAPLTVSSTVAHTSCYGTTDGSATAHPAGGIPPYTYTWASSPVQNTAVATALAPGTYSLTVTDSNGCVTTGTAMIVQPAPIIAGIGSTPATCGNSDGSASISILSGGVSPFTYSWTPGGATTATAAGIPSGTYTVIITDSTGCTKTDTANVSNSNSGTASITTQSGCFGMNNGSATVTMTGGTHPFTYSWSTSPVQSGNIASGLPPGLYHVMVTDSSGCITFASGTVSTPVVLVADSLTHTPISCSSCSDATAKIYASGGSAPYTYSWSTSPAQTGQTATGLGVGIYTVCITDANGCIQCDSVSIDHTLGIAVYQTGTTKLSYFPNPSTGLINIEIQSEEAQRATFRVFNLVGMTVYTEEIELSQGSVTKTLDLSGNPKGMYLIQMVLIKGSITEKLILH